MAKLYCPKCPDFDGFVSSTNQAIGKVAAYEWCQKYLTDLEESNDTVTLSTSLFLSIIRKAYMDAHYSAQKLEFDSWAHRKEYPLNLRTDDSKDELEKLGLLGQYKYIKNK